MRSHISTIQLQCLSVGLMIALMPWLAQAAILRVGGNQCDFYQIQPAIDLAAALPGPDTIRIAMDASFTAQALRIGAQDLDIVGGFATCTSEQATAGAKSTISGQGGAADSVIVITGSGNRSLSGLAIIGGDETDNGRGGGIDFEGAGVLAVNNLLIDNNRAGYGGGINFNGATSAGATLSLGANTTIQTNFAANSGGGVRIEGVARLYMLEPHSTIAGNRALGQADDSGYGGGLQIIPPATAEIGAPGLGDLGAISSNVAKYGGGIAITPRGDDDSGLGRGSALLYTTNPQRPVRIDHNVASQAGGGVYLGVNSDFATWESSILCAYEFRLDHNRAPDGAALFSAEEYSLGYPSGSDAYLNVADVVTDIFCGVSAMPPTSIAVQCAMGVACNSIDHNRVVDANGQPADGAIIELHHESTLVADRVRWSNNRGSDVIHALRSEYASGVELSNCLFDGNTLTARAIATAAPLSIRNCTIAGNTIGFNDVIAATDTVAIDNSIVWQPGQVSLGADHGPLTGAFNLSNDPISLPQSTTLNLEPRFIDPATGNFRLRAASPAIDVAPAIAGDDRDLDNRPRDQDLQSANGIGPRDLGPYERGLNDPLLLNPDFLTDVSFWPEETPGVSGFDPRENDADRSRGGSMFFNYQTSDAILSRVIARTQCAHLPAPGNYRLSGSARTSGSMPPMSVQNAILHWELRLDGGEACTEGRVYRSGDLRITSGSNWARVSAQIASLGHNEWTRNSSITVSVVMANGGVAVRPALRGWFDAVQLQLE